MNNVDDEQRMQIFADKGKIVLVFFKPLGFEEVKLTPDQAKLLVDFCYLIADKLELIKNDSHKNNV